MVVKRIGVLHVPRKHSGQLVEREFLTLAVWDNLDRDTCQQVALTVEKCLPEPWKFKEIAWHECGGQKRFVAFYTWKKPGRFQEATFALIPGGEVELGYDPKRPHQIPHEIIEEGIRIFESRNWGKKVLSPSEVFVSELSKLRIANLAPYLIEVEADQKVRKTGKSERKRFEKMAMRLPTIDEWEFACSGGSRSIWFWGDALVDPTMDANGLYLNAFGLRIGLDPGCTEPVHEGTEIRGCNTTPPYRTLFDWLGLSTWNHTKPLRSGRSNCEDYWYFLRWRRVFPLPPEMLG